MSQFLSSLKDELTAMEEEIQTLPGELDSVVARLDRGKLRNLLLALDRDFDEVFNQYLGKLFARQGGWALAAPFVIEPTPPYIRSVTNGDVQRWRQTFKSDMRVVVGKGKVEVMAACGLVAQQEGYIVLSWGQYQKLLDKMGKLIGEDEKALPGAIVGIPVTTTDSTPGVKVLPKSSPT